MCHALLPCPITQHIRQSCVLQGFDGIWSLARLKIGEVGGRPDDKEIISSVFLRLARTANVGLKLTFGDDDDDAIAVAESRSNRPHEPNSQFPASETFTIYSSGHTSCCGPKTFYPRLCVGNPSAPAGRSGPEGSACREIALKGVFLANFFAPSGTSAKVPLEYSFHVGNSPPYPLKTSGITGK